MEEQHINPNIENLSDLETQINSQERLLGLIEQQIELLTQQRSGKITQAKLVRQRLARLVSARKNISKVKEGIARDTLENDKGRN